MAENVLTVVEEHVTEILVPMVTTLMIMATAMATVLTVVEEHVTEILVLMVTPLMITATAMATIHIIGDKTTSLVTTTIPTAMLSAPTANPTPVLMQTPEDSDSMATAVTVVDQLWVDTFSQMWTTTFGINLMAAIMGALVCLLVQVIYDTYTRTRTRTDTRNHTYGRCYFEANRGNNISRWSALNMYHSFNHSLRAIFAKSESKSEIETGSGYDDTDKSEMDTEEYHDLIEQQNAEWRRVQGMLAQYKGPRQEDESDMSDCFLVVVRYQ